MYPEQIALGHLSLTFDELAHLSRLPDGIHLRPLGRCLLGVVRAGHRTGLTLLRGERLLGFIGLQTDLPDGSCHERMQPLLALRRSGEVLWVLTTVDGCQNEAYGRGLYRREHEDNTAEFRWDEEDCTGMPLSGDPVMMPILDKLRAERFGHEQP